MSLLGTSAGEDIKECLKVKVDMHCHDLRSLHIGPRLQCPWQLVYTYCEAKYGTYRSDANNLLSLTSFDQ